MKLLDETSGLQVLKSMFAGVSEARLAVAFWGRGAVEALGLDRPGLKLDILCNLDSGACNPIELRRLLGLSTVRLRAHPALHAKIYWTPARAVLGSSNASSNGLAVEGQMTGWREANLLVEDVSVVREIGELFETLFAEGYDVKTEHIDRCGTLWDARARLTPTGERLAKTLFDAFAAAPEHPAWASVKVAYCSDPLDKGDEDWLAGEITAKRMPDAVSAYAEWNEKIRAGDVVIDFWHRGGAASAQGLWLAETSLAAEERNLRLVREVDGFMLSGLGQFTLTNAERRVLAELKTVVLQLHSTDGGRNAIVNFSEAMTLLDATTARPDPKAFNQAMQRIYDEATTFGYRPVYLLKMLREHGGVVAAKLLIQGRATKGFDRLWEEKRLDLSVEALILKPEWQALFNAADKMAARRRLRQYGYRADAPDDLTS